MRGRGRWLGVVLVLALLGAGSLALLGGDRSGPSVGPPSGAVDASLEPGSIELADASTTSDPGTARTSVPAAIDPDPVESAPFATTEPERVTLRGTWTVIDTQGVERTAEHGSFRVRVYTPRHDLEVPVRAGRWELELAPSARFDVLDVELGGRYSDPVSRTGDLAVPPELRLDLIARWPREVVLTIRDAATHTQLSDLTVVASTWQPGGDPARGEWVHPGAFDPAGESVLVRGASSPIVLPVVPHARDREPLWVRAPGYAWGHIVVPRSVGGEFLVDLHRGGDLAVNVVGLAPGVAAWIRLRDPATLDDEERWEGIRYQARPVEGGGPSLELESLQVGEYQVALEIGHRYRFPLAVVAEAARILAGERTVVELDASGYQPPARATMEGTLVVPPAWELDSFQLFVDLVGAPAADGDPRRVLQHADMRAVDAGAGEFAFAAEDMQVGDYELRFNPLGTTFPVTLPPGGRRDVRLEVPPPADVVVRVVEAETEAPVDDADVYWMPDREGLDSGGVLNQAGPIGDGGYRFRTPAAAVEVWVFSERWTFQHRRFDAEPGANEWTIETTRACGVALRVSDAGTHLPVEEFEPRIVRVSDDEEAQRSDEDDPGLLLRYVAPGPGLYRVELTAPEGYAPIPPRDVAIPAGEFVDVDIEVLRSG